MRVNFEQSYLGPRSVNPVAITAGNCKKQRKHEEKVLVSEAPVSGGTALINKEQCSTWKVFANRRDGAGAKWQKKHSTTLPGH